MGTKQVLERVWLTLHPRLRLEQSPSSTSLQQLGFALPCMAPTNTTVSKTTETHTLCAGCTEECCRSPHHRIYFFYYFFSKDNMSINSFTNLKAFALYWNAQPLFSLASCMPVQSIRVV